MSNSNPWTNEDKFEEKYSSKPEEEKNEETLIEVIEPILEEKTEEVKPSVSSDELEAMFSKYNDNSVMLEKLDTIIELLQAKPQGEPKETENGDDIAVIAKNQEQNRNLLTTYIKQNAEFQQQVRTDMNKENETLKKEILGERLDPLLKGIATVFGEYYSLLEDDATEDKKYQIRVRYMFESLEDVMSEYGCEFNTSKVGEERSPRTTKIRQPLQLTGDPSLHRTIIKSFNPSISKGKKVLCPEFVSIYKYDESLAKELEEVQEEVIEIEPVENTETIEKEINEEGEN